eukprot:jgi/Chlat1/2831/Chrsp187S02925
MPLSAHLPADWTSEQAKFIYQQLSNSRFGAVSRASLQRDMPGANKTRAVSSMLENNAIFQRPTSALARDIPVDVFNGEDDMLITATSAKQLRAIRKLFPPQEEEGKHHATVTLACVVIPTQLVIIKNWKEDQAEDSWWRTVFAALAVS